MSAASEVFKDTLQAINGDLIPANLFGKPCAKFEGGKPFLAFFKDCMAYKLGAERCQEIMAEYPECQPFDPSGKGRPFKGWVQVPEGAGLDWIKLGQEAIAVQELSQ